MNAKCRSMSCNKPVQQKENSKNYAGDAVGGHEGEVYAAEVVGFYEAVLVDEHGAEKYYPNIIQYADMGKKRRHDNKGCRKHMQKGGQPQSVHLTEPGGDGMQVFGAVEIFILQGVNNVEAAYPA